MLTEHLITVEHLSMHKFCFFSLYEITDILSCLFAMFFLYLVFLLVFSKAFVLCSVPGQAVARARPKNYIW